MGFPDGRILRCATTDISTTFPPPTIEICSRPTLTSTCHNMVDSVPGVLLGNTKMKDGRGLPTM